MSPPGDDDRRTVEEWTEDWRFVCASRLNVLLVGPGHPTKAATAALKIYLIPPVGIVSAGCLGELSRLKDVRSLIVEEICDLTGEEQRELNEWLSKRVGRIQVVSTSRFTLETLIVQGQFLDTLYYRLNTIYIDAVAALGH